MGSVDPKYRLRKVSSVKVIWTVEQQDFGTQEPSCSSVPQAAMANLEDKERSKSTLINLACFPKGVNWPLRKLKASQTGHA